jgi:di/tricarboxylate transporter
VLLPAVAVLGRRVHIPSSRLMMPLAYGAILGGTLTLIGTTPHLILGEELYRYTLQDATVEAQRLGIFEFAKIGAPVAALGVIYMAFIGVRFLPKHRAQERLRKAQLPDELARSYGFEDNLYIMRLVEESTVTGQSVADAALGAKYDLDIVLIYRPDALPGQRYIHPSPGFVFEAGDQIYVEGETEDAWAFSTEATVQFNHAGPDAVEQLLGHGVTMGEIALTPHSEAIGQTLKEVDFRKKYGLNVVSLWRREQVVSGDIGDQRLELGDACLVSGPADKLRGMRDDPDFILLGDYRHVGDTRRAPIAIFGIIVALFPPLIGWLPLSVSVIAGGLLMVITGCLSPGQARRAVDWQILFLLIGTIPLGLALEQNDVALLVANAIRDLQPHLGTAGILAALYLISAVLSTTSNNAATAVILAPVAWMAAQASGIPPAKAFLAVAYGTSCAFLLPFAHQCNLMVMGPAAYETRDFVKAGIGMSIVVAAGTITLLAVF